MSHRDGNGTPPELAPIVALLEEERPTASALDLDALKLRARRQAATAKPRTRTKGNWMKSRLALTAMIAVGLMLSGTGATLAITGSSGSGNAAQQQYDSVQPVENNENPQTLGVQEEGGEPPQDQSPESSESPVSDVEQVAVAGDSGESLPFTGFFTIPLILGGVALLTAGLFLRRKSDG